MGFQAVASPVVASSAAIRFRDCPPIVVKSPPAYAVLPLTANFRTVPSVIAFVNDQFRDIFVQPGDPHVKLAHGGGIEWTIKDGIPYHVPTLMKEVKDMVVKARTERGRATSSPPGR